MPLVIFQQNKHAKSNFPHEAGYHISLSTHILTLNPDVLFYGTTINIRKSSTELLKSIST